MIAGPLREDCATTQTSLERLQKGLLEFERTDHVSDDMRTVVESEWPELAHKLPPKERH
jgi:hypothetical protein